LYSALLTNMPYDRFVAELVNPSAESEGFTRGIVWRGVVNASQSPPMQAAQNIAQVFMGVNLKCASCHDSFINDWRLSDAYGLASVYSDGPLEMFHCDKPTGRMSEPRFIYPELGPVDAKAAKADRLKQLADLITGPKDGRLPRTIVNRLWARFLGIGLVEPVDDMEQAPWSREMLDMLAADFASNRYDLKRAIEDILTSRAYQLPSVDVGGVSSKGYIFRGPAIRRMSAEQFRDAVGQLTGVWYGKSELALAKGPNRSALVAADALVTALGRPNREQVATTRSTVATTLQALELTNGQTLAAVLDAGAEKLLERYPEPRLLAQDVYRLALNRSPTALETEACLELLGGPVQKHGVADLLWVITMLPEFQLIY
ncbi:MAG TPA: DUF1553 domain-containing protein, partial [Clostridia bacterium]|nr:DUF1553 domain-containing protein [Clostridia bacterium]